MPGLFGKPWFLRLALRPFPRWAALIVRYRLFASIPPLRALADKYLDGIIAGAFGLSRQFAPAIRGTDCGVEVHSLLCSAHLDMYLWSLRTFLHYGQGGCALVIHDDGSLTDADCAQLLRQVPWARIIRRAEGDQQIVPKLAGFPACITFRATNVWGIKLLDVNLLTDAAKLLLLDSDILFFRSADELKAAMISSEEMVFYNHERGNTFYSAQPGLVAALGDVIDGFNAGFMGWPRSFVDLPACEEILAWLAALPPEIKRGVYNDQTVYALIAARHPHGALGSDYSAVDDSVAEKNLVFKHYHSVSKRYMALEGIGFILSHRREFLRAMGVGSKGSA